MHPTLDPHLPKKQSFAVAAALCLCFFFKQTDVPAVHTANVFKRLPLPVFCIECGTSVAVVLSRHKYGFMYNI
jgi:hypothetical protein